MLKLLVRKCQFAIFGNLRAAQKIARFTCVKLVRSSQLEVTLHRASAAPSRIPSNMNTTTPHHQLDEITVQEAMQAFGLSKPQIYWALQYGVSSRLTDGPSGRTKLRLINRASLEAFLAKGSRQA
jgi:hypothetical protein